MRCWKSNRTTSRAARHCPRGSFVSGGALQQFPGLALQLEAGVLMGLAAGERRDALHEIEDALGLAMFFAQHGFDDLRRLRFGETALAQKALAVLVATGDDPLPRRLDPGDERGRRGIGETRERRCRLVSKTLCGKFGMPDRDLLEILDTPEIAVHAHRPEIKRSDAKGLRSNFRVPAIEAPEIQIRRSVRQASRLDRMGIVDQKQEYIAVAGIKRRGILG